MLWGASGGVDEGVFFHQLVDKLFLVIFCPSPTCRRFSLCFCPQAYKAVGRALEWDVLGVAEDEAAMAQYREEVGTLADRRWESLTFLMPEKEATVFLCFLERGNKPYTIYLFMVGGCYEESYQDRPVLVGC